MPKAFFNFLEFALSWTKSQHFGKFYELFIYLFITAQIQTKHVGDYMRKENTTISLIDWKIMMFNHEGVKITKVIWSLSILFSHVKTKKNGHPKDMRLKGIMACITPINLRLFKIYSIIFLNEFLM